MHNKKIINTINNKHKITDYSDHKQVIKTLRSCLSDHSVKTYISAIIQTVEDEELKDKYRRHMQPLKLHYNKRLLDNELLDNHKISYIAYDKLINIYIYCHQNHAYTDALLLALYLFFPPRRLEYCEMVIKDHKPKELDMNLNYYINKRNGYFIFNNYKTSKKYKTQYFEVPSDLDMVIKQYIYYEGKEDDDYLIGVKGRTHFVERINRAINITDPEKKVGVQILRHSFVSYFFEKSNYELAYTPQFLRGVKFGVRASRKFSRMMAHSVEQQMTYIKSV